jgi:riboflavin transporter FmnP
MKTTNSVSDKIYWLRGALIALFVHMVLSIVLLILGSYMGGSVFIFTILFPNQLFAAPLYMFLAHYNVPNIFGIHSVIYYIGAYWFIVGAVGGWLYGRSKESESTI